MVNIIISKPIRMNSLATRNVNTLFFLSIYFSIWAASPGPNTFIPILNFNLLFYMLYDLYYYAMEMGIDMVVHHILTTLLVISSMYYPTHWDILKPFYLAEISTFFLVFSKMPTVFYPFLRHVSKFLFIWTFIYFRVYSMGYTLLYQGLELTLSFWFAYSLWLLNLYWFCMIIEKILVWET